MTRRAWLVEGGVAAAAALAALAVLRTLRERPLALDDQPLDAWIYATMADEPRVFTIAPWGYRLLVPTLVHLTRSGQGFPLLALAALAAAAAAMAVFLRRLGHGVPAALAGALAFAVSAPAGHGVRHPYLTEPAGVALETAFLAALHGGAGPGALALLLLAAVYAKELLLVLAAGVFLVRHAEVGPRAAAGQALVVATPSIATLVLLRLAWTPYVATPEGPAVLAQMPRAMALLADGWRDTGILLGGLFPLAVVGAAVPAGRRYARTYGPLAALFVALPFTAWMNNPRPGGEPFFGGTVERLLVYAVPLLVPLALAALGSLLPRLRVEGRPEAPRRGRGDRALLAVAVGAATLPLWALDGYRRRAPGPALDGVVIRAVCRETLRAAARVGAGEAVTFDPEERALAPGRAARVRWPLASGWGPFPYRETGPVVTVGDRASLLVPSLGAGKGPDEVVLVLSADRPVPVVFSVNGLPSASADVGPQPSPFAVPTRELFRGDNTLELRGGDGVRLHGVTYRRAR